MDKKYQILTAHNVVSVRDVQQSPSRALRGITRVMKNGNTMGFYFSNEEFAEILEDLEALGSLELKQRVRQARQNLLKNKNFTSLSQVAKKYGL